MAITFHSIRVVSPKLLRQAITTCVLPIAYYGVETWWPGLSRTVSPTQSVSNLVRGHISLLQRVVQTSVLAIFPVHRTTPTNALYREVGLSPPEIILDLKLRQASLPTYWLNPRHPFRRRITWILDRKRRVSRISGRTLTFSSIELLDLLIDPSGLRKKISTPEPDESPIPLAISLVVYLLKI